MADIKNRARDSEIEQYQNVRFVEGEQFPFADGLRGVKGFWAACNDLARNTFVETMTFQLGQQDEGITFDSKTIEKVLLKNGNLRKICENSQIDRVYILLKDDQLRTLLVVIEKKHGDSVIYYDRREYEEEEANTLFKWVENENDSQLIERVMSKIDWSRINDEDYLI